DARAHGLARLWPFGADDTAREHHHALAKRAAALDAVIGEPGECSERMAQHVGALASPLLHVTHGHAAAERREIEPAPVPDGRSDHRAAVPGVVGDQAARAHLLILSVLILDDLDTGMAGVDGIGDALAVVRPTAPGKILAETHRDLAFDGDVDVVAPLDGHGTLVEEAVEDRAGAGMPDAHQVLHYLRGDGDLVTDDRPARLRPPLLQDLLRGISLIEISRLDLRRKRRQIAPRARESVEVIGDALDAGSVGHGASSSEIRRDHGDTIGNR